MNSPKRCYHVRYFASVRETVGLENEIVESDAATVGDLRQELISRGDAYALGLGANTAIRAAVNHQMVGDDSPLPTDGEMEVAFFPPVTGG